jgi:hypothetical protein
VKRTPEELATERIRLRRQIAQDRAELAQFAQRLERPLRVYDEVQTTAQFVRRHFVFIALPVVALMVWRPRATMRMAVGLLGVWRGYKLAHGEDTPLIDAIDQVLPASVRPG